MPLAFFGTAAVGFEVQSFQPYGSDQDYWLALSDPDYKNYFPLGDEPYSEQFIYVEGEFVHGEVDEFALEYDGVLEVSSVAIVTSTSESSDPCKI